MCSKASAPPLSWVSWKRMAPVALSSFTMALLRESMPQIR